uniref:Uncharacterized protein n=1 Tax=Pristionchus pacificus TaxID=54126 RepID=A0A2A6C8B9_PRIPA|eukprot:PDM74455.1 hypothetical protein PRIPAC_41811 [Pristionchus pacificus]
MATTTPAPAPTNNIHFRLTSIGGGLELCRNDKVIRASSAGGGVRSVVAGVGGGPSPSTWFTSMAVSAPPLPPPP